jgi:Protein of unknown function (DUF1579)
MRGSSRITAAMAVILGLAVGAGAQEKAKKAPGNPEVAAALENAMTPGEGQKKLGFMVGMFDVKIRTWATPSSPPSEDTGVMVGEWVLGGRYIQMMLAGNIAGEPYSGIGYAGFDNTTKKHVATFMDTGGTGMEWYTGGFDATGKRATLKASVTNPVTGKPSPLEMRLTIDAAGNHVTELWGQGLGQTMFKMMELAYTKRKQ